VVNHPILEDVKGHFHSHQFLKFFTSGMYLEVVKLMLEKEDGFEDPRAGMDVFNMNEEDFLYNQHLVLTEFLRSECIGSREPETGDVYRGTIIMDGWNEVEYKILS